jgi:hypothetical protein
MAQPFPIGAVLWVDLGFCRPPVHLLLLHKTNTIEADNKVSLQLWDGIINQLCIKKCNHMLHRGAYTLCHINQQPATGHIIASLTLAFRNAPLSSPREMSASIFSRLSSR